MGILNGSYYGDLNTEGQFGTKRRSNWDNFGAGTTKFSVPTTERRKDGEKSIISFHGYREMAYQTQMLFQFGIQDKPKKGALEGPRGLVPI